MPVWIMAALANATNQAQTRPNAAPGTPNLHSTYGSFPVVFVFTLNTAVFAVM